MLSLISGKGVCLYEKGMMDVCLGFRGMEFFSLCFLKSVTSNINERTMGYVYLLSLFPFLQVLTVT